MLQTSQEAASSESSSQSPYELTFCKADHNHFSTTSALLALALCSKILEAVQQVQSIGTLEQSWSAIDAFALTEDDLRSVAKTICARELGRLQTTLLGAVLPQTRIMHQGNSVCVMGEAAKRLGKACGRIGGRLRECSSAQRH